MVPAGMRSLAALMSALLKFRSMTFVEYAKKGSQYTFLYTTLLLSSKRRDRRMSLLYAPICGLLGPSHSCKIPIYVVLLIELQRIPLPP